MIFDKEEVIKIDSQIRGSIRTAALNPNNLEVINHTADTLVDFINTKLTQAYEAGRREGIEEVRKGFEGQFEFGSGAPTADDYPSGYKQGVIDCLSILDHLTHFQDGTEEKEK